jgi:histidyl-tRNA synthetase
MEIQKPKGTYDLYDDNSQKVLYLENIIFSLCEKYNYQYFRTPIFEKSELFHRGVGETTDIVSKETYDFIDRGNRNMTLRPEGTAGLVRSFIENKLYANPNTPIKTFYYGPMFRYERPQSGRFREFYQFGVEVFGSNDASIDAEVISIPVNFYKMLGLKEIKVNINTLGDNESRLKYKDVLINYLTPNIDKLCPDCKNRLDKNPLRILDCKVDRDLDIIKNAPTMDKYLNEESKAYFEQVKHYLELLDIDYEVNVNLVRGLDYYNHTVFEIEASIEGFGSQNVLCAGGRYNTLVSTLGGPDTPGIGFAFGMERLVSALEQEKITLPCDNTIDIFIAYISDEEKDMAIALLQTLRLSGFIADMDYMGRNLKGQFKQADRLNSKYIIIIGEEERKNNQVTIKNNITKENEQKINIADLIDYLDESIGE